MISKAGKRIIGNKETTPKGNPSFVQRVTKRAMSPRSEACVTVKTVKESAKTKAPINIPSPIFFKLLFVLAHKICKFSISFFKGKILLWIISHISSASIPK